MILFSYQVCNPAFLYTCVYWGKENKWKIKWNNGNWNWDDLDWILNPVQRPVGSNQTWTVFVVCKKVSLNVYFHLHRIFQLDFCLCKAYWRVENIKIKRCELEIWWCRWTLSIRKTKVLFRMNKIWISGSFLTIFYWWPDGLVRLVFSVWLRCDPDSVKFIELKCSILCLLSSDWSLNECPK